MADTDARFKLIRVARVIDGNGGPPIERGAVLLEGEDIRAVGPEETVAAPEGARVEEFDYKDQTLLPGLVDCHVHLVGIGDGRMGDELTTLPDEVLTLQAARNARTHLYSGVTTVRDCGAKNQTTFMLRKAVEMGITPAPRMVLTGRPVAIVGGHLSYFGIQATGPNECRAAVRQLVKEGADFIKITATGGSTRTSLPMRPSFNVDELTAICDEIHKFGKHAAAHCVSSQAMLNCLDAGIDTIIHGRFMEPDGSVVYREEITDRIVDQDVMVNYNMGGHRQRMLALEDKREAEGLPTEEQDQLNVLRETSKKGQELYSHMRSAGVKMVCGSDSAWGNYKMGQFYYETEAHVAAGMRPMEAIVAATSDSARSCWVDGEVGSLDPGKRADLLVVDGDPSLDITALRNVVDVFQGGGVVDRGNLV
jgi:imidazolonepropionase-like amidohydrolase